MNTELRGLLESLGVETGSRGNAWERAILVLNFGAVPPIGDASVGGVFSGFKLVLLDARERPAWFARCGRADDAGVAQEAALLERLAADPIAARFVPGVRIGRSEHLLVQVSPYLGSDSYSKRVAQRSANAWGRDLLDILRIDELVLERAIAAAPDLLEMATPRALEQSVERDFSRLLERDIADTETIELLRGAIEPLKRFPPALQHGDLWPPNILRHGGRWWLIDFAECGQVWAPLYDAFHMLSNGPPGSADREWYALGEGARPDHWGEVRYAILRELAGRIGLSEAQVGAALTYYLIHLSAYRLRPGVERVYSVRLTQELMRVAACLRAGKPLSQLVPIRR